jgi:hypothetical protein
LVSAALLLASRTKDKGQKKQNPTREWGQRYDEAFERAVVFLDTSRITYEAELKNQEMMQKGNNRRRCPY